MLTLHGEMKDVSRAIRARFVLRARRSAYRASIRRYTFLEGPCCAAAGICVVGMSLEDVWFLGQERETSACWAVNAEVELISRPTFPLLCQYKDNERSEVSMLDVTTKGPGAG